MRVAIIHYHLRPGGVTRVIENAVRGIGQAAKAVVLAAGEYTNGKIPHRVRVEALGYSEKPDILRAEAFSKELEEAACAALDGTPDLWHIHNPALGKNPLLAAALPFLLRNGARLLLQTHDFAEDGRPALYANQIKMLGGPEGYAASAWPSAPQVHYAVLNGRDLGILRQAGIAEQQCHLLPNAVEVAEFSQATDAPPVLEAPFLLYPTRGIRRKNLGELALLAAGLLRSGSHLQLATSLSPANPLWRSIHDDWVSFSADHRLPIAFAVGERQAASFSQLIHCCETLISTSITEGFGLAYLEPFLFGKEIVGRDLPDITRDFKESGLDMSNLYSRPGVRLSDDEQNKWRASIGEQLQRVYQAYGRTPPEGAVDASIASATVEGLVDFGRLDEPLQRVVISRLLDSPNPAKILPEFPDLSPREPYLLQANRDVVKSRYSAQACGQTLLGTYRSVLASPHADPAAHNAGHILDAFLHPETFNLLKT